MWAPRPSGGRGRDRGGVRHERAPPRERHALTLARLLLRGPEVGTMLDRDLKAARNLAALAGEVIGGTSSQSCGATVNESNGNARQTHTVWATGTATGRPTRSTPRRKATATRTSGPTSALREMVRGDERSRSSERERPSYNSTRRPGDRGSFEIRGKSGHRRAGRWGDPGGESRRKVAQKGDRLQRFSGDAEGKGERVG